MWQRQSPLTWIPCANYTGAAMARRVRIVRKAYIWGVPNKFPLLLLDLIMVSFRKSQGPADVAAQFEGPRRRIRGRYR